MSASLSLNSIKVIHLDNQLGHCCLHANYVIANETEYDWLKILRNLPLCSIQHRCMRNVVSKKLNVKTTSSQQLLDFRFF